MPIALPSFTAAASSSSARTTSCWPSTATTPISTASSCWKKSWPKCREYRRARLQPCPIGCSRQISGPFFLANAFPSAYQDSALAPAAAAVAASVSVPSAESVVDGAAPPAASCLDRHACFQVADLLFPDVAGVFDVLSVPARTTCLVAFDISGPASCFLSLEALGAHAAAAHSDASLYQDEECSPAQRSPVQHCHVPHSPVQLYPVQHCLHCAARPPLEPAALPVR